MFVIEMISHLARPLSLSLRLFGNMTGGHILLAVIFFLMGFDGLIGWALEGSAAGARIGRVRGVVPPRVPGPAHVAPGNPGVPFYGRPFLIPSDQLHLARARDGRDPLLKPQLD